MASTITSSNPRILAERTFKDLDLSFIVHPVRKDINKHVNEYAVINSVKNLVSTNFYEKPFRPEIGSGIRSLLFENVDPIISARLERAIVETITNYEPRVEISGIRATAYPDENRYNISMEFFIINNPSPITIDFFLERIR
jgi:phage baseplate assembly protein W